MKQISSLLLFLLITIECIKSKQKPIRNYIILRDSVIKLNRLSSYTVYDSTGKKSLYKLKTTSSTDIDTIVVISLPEKNIIANLEGEWAEKIFQVTFSIYDKKLNKWNDEAIIKNSSLFGTSYTTKWLQNTIQTKNKFLTNTMQIYRSMKNDLIAEIRKRSPWLGEVKFEMKIYSNNYPDAIFFFLLAIDDHKNQIDDLNS